MNPRNALVALALAAALLSGCDKPAGQATAAAAAPPLQFQGVDITGAEYAKTLSLPDAKGQPRTLADFKGKVVVVFFGYTQCPDVCPTTMAELAQVKKALGPDGERVQGIFVTVDPQRDTPEVLTNYLASFDPSFVALRGTPEQTQAVAKEFKVFFAKVPGTTEGSYTVDHTAGSYILDANGNIRVFERYGGGVPALTADLKALLASGG
jgi:protein SCO1